MNPFSGGELCEDFEMSATAYPQPTRVQGIETSALPHVKVTCWLDLLRARSLGVGGGLPRTQASCGSSPFGDARTRHHNIRHLLSKIEVSLTL